MRKIFSTVLVATALLFSMQANAATDLQSLINAATGRATTTEITLTDDVTCDLGSGNIAIFNRNIKINMNGKTIQSTGTAIFLVNATLELAGNGSVVVEGTPDAIRVMGSANPTVDSAYTNLIVREGVSVIGGKGIQVYTMGCGYNYAEGAYASIVNLPGILPVSGTTTAANIVNTMNLNDDDKNTLMDSYKKYQSACSSTSAWGYAFGVVVEVFGNVSGREYGIQTSGTIRGMRADKNDQEIFTGSKTANWPLVIIRNGATITGVHNEATGTSYPGRYPGNKKDDSYPTGCYAAGYADWVIEGKVTGDNGVVVKSGTVKVESGANISATGAYEPAKTAGAGTQSSGNAIDLTTDNSYSGAMQVIISGGSTMTSTNGYALKEEIAEGADVSNKTNNVVITGGTFKSSSDKSAVQTTTEVKQQIVQNGTLTGGTYSSDDISTYLPAVSGLITIEVDENNKPVYVIGGSETPVEWKNESLNSVEDGAYVQIKGAEYNCTLAKDVNIAYLSMADAEEDATVTIPAGKVMNVGEVVLGANAQIVVEAGGKLVVNGENGFIAFDADNLVIKASAEGSGIFVLNPAVKGNKTPWATVEYACDPLAGKFTLSEKTAYYWDIISSPFAQMTSIETTGNTSYYQRVVDGAYVNVSSKQEIYDNVGAFDALAICPNADRGTITYTMQGKLQGATSLDNYTVVKGFNHMGNAYTAVMNAKELVTELQQNATAIRTLIYIWSTESQKYICYNGYKLQELGNINPLKSAFLYSDDAASAKLNYKKLVWDVNQ